MAEVSAKSFLGLLQRSGLCDQSELKATIAELFEKANGGSVKLDQLTSHLLEQGLVSEWHIKKLRNGKYKGFFLGKYKLLRHLGTGGMSTVYLAQHTIFNQQRAVKVLPRDRVADKSYLERFYREGRAAAALNHRNIVRVYDIDHEGDTHYLVMEYVKGEDIYEKVKRHGPLTCQQAIDYTVQTMTGLQHAHENDLVHRDIKPANLLVTPDDDVKILDLGLALFREEDTSLTVMHNERVLGTADYLSPEQAVNSHNVDRRSDIYSAGCTLYFMLTGKPPFPEGSIAQRIAKHQSCEPQDISEFRSDVPPDLLAVVHKMMRKKADERYSGCDPLAAELRSVADGLLLGPPKISTSGDSDQQAKKAPVTESVSIEPGVMKSDSKKPGSGKSGSRKSGSKSDSRRVVKSGRASEKDATNNPVSAKAKTEASTEANTEARTEGKAPSRKTTPPNRTDNRSAESREKNKPATSEKPAAAKKKSDSKRPVATAPQKKSSAMASQKVSNAAESKAKPEGSRGTAKNRPRKTAESKQHSAPIDVGKKPQVKAEEVSVILGGDEPENASSKVGVNEFRSFVAQNRTTKRTTAKPKRDSRKDQWMIAGLVIGMLLLLAIVLVVAKSFVTRGKEESTTMVVSHKYQVCECQVADRNHTFLV